VVMRDNTFKGGRSRKYISGFESSQAVPYYIVVWSLRHGRNKNTIPLLFTFCCLIMVGCCDSTILTYSYIYEYISFILEYKIHILHIFLIAKLRCILSYRVSYIRNITT
jgi:hypothetical protein